MVFTIWARLLFGALFCLAGIVVNVFQQEDFIVQEGSSVVVVPVFIFRAFALFVSLYGAIGFYKALKEWGEYQKNSVD